jgi:hypothetical protein
LTSIFSTAVCLDPSLHLCCPIPQKPRPSHPDHKKPHTRTQMCIPQSPTDKPLKSARAARQEAPSKSTGKVERRSATQDGATMNKSSTSKTLGKKKKSRRPQIHQIKTEKVPTAHLNPFSSEQKKTNFHATHQHLGRCSSKKAKQHPVPAYPSCEQQHHKRKGR